MSDQTAEFKRRMQELTAEVDRMKETFDRQQRLMSKSIERSTEQWKYDLAAVERVMVEMTRPEQEIVMAGQVKTEKDAEIEYLRNQVDRRMALLRKARDEIKALGVRAEQANRQLAEKDAEIKRLQDQEGYHKAFRRDEMYELKRTYKRAETLGARAERAEATVRAVRSLMISWKPEHSSGQCGCAWCDMYSDLCTVLGEDS